MALTTISALFLLIMPALTTSQPTCNTDADADCNGQVTLTELQDYIQLWYGCSSCYPDLYDAVHAYVYSTGPSIPEKAYYVRDGATGRGDGSDWTNAYTDLPTSLERGATYWVADGDYSGSHTFNDPEQGSEYITIKKAVDGMEHGSASDWNGATMGSGVARFIIPDGASPYSFSFKTGYYIIDGQVGGGPGQWDSGFGFRFDTETRDSDGRWANFGLGDSSEAPSYLEFRHLEIYNPNRDPYDTDMGWYSDTGHSSQHITISRCYWHDGRFFIDSRHSKNWTIEYSYIARNNPDYEGSPQGEFWQAHGNDSYHILRYNIFEDGFGTAAIAMKKFGHLDHFGWEFYGNVFYSTPNFDNGFGNGVIADTNKCVRDGVTCHTSDMKIYNNVFINIEGVNAAPVYFRSPITENNEVYNNIFYDMNTTAGWPFFYGVNHDYNWFYEIYRNDNSEADILANNETNGQLGTEDPFINWTGMDFRLKQGTDPGLILQAPYDKDWFGNPRGDDGVWDRGAVEYQEPAAQNEFYVRDGSGLTSNCGQDWANACEDLNNFASLQRGATYYIADGTYGGHLFNDDDSSGEYITIKKAVNNDMGGCSGIECHGTEAGWNQEYGNGVAEWIMNDPNWYLGKWNEKLLFHTSYYIFDGRVGGGPGSWDSGHGFKLTFGPGINTSKDNALIEIGQWDPLIEQPDFIEIKHTEMTSPYRKKYDHEYAIWGAQNFWLVDDANHSNPPPGDQNQGPRNITISYNYIHDLLRPLQTSLCQDWVIEYNYIARNDVPASNQPNQGTALHDFASDYMIIRYNIFEDIDGTANIDIKKNFPHYDNFGWEIYGNVFWYTPNNTVIGTGPSGVIGDTGMQCATHCITNDMKVYDNSVINLHGGNTGVHFGATEALNNKVYNNIWYNCSASEPFFFIGVNDHNYNWYYDVEQQGITASSLAASETNGQLGSGDPFENWVGMDFRLKQATDPGLTLPAPYDQDWFGNPRGQDGNWDRGAVEYTGGAPPVPDCSVPSDCADRACNTKDCVSGNCVYSPVTDGPHASCQDDGLYCNGAEACQSGSCVSSGSPCGAGEACNETSDTCYEVTFPTDYVSYWKFNGDATDSGPGANHGITGGDPTYVTGQQGQAIEFDGYEDHVQTSSIDFTGTDKITVSFWANPNTASTDDDILIEFSDNFNRQTDSFIVFFGSSEQAFMALYGTPGGYSQWETDSILTPGQWTHVVAVFDKSLSSNESKGYINGSLDGLLPQYDRDNTNNFGNRSLYMASRAGTGAYFNGLLDEVMIYNRSLSAAEIDQIYQAQK